MYHFTTRIVLHDPANDAYEKLHLTMAEQGFSRTIVSFDGREYQLPDAEYYLFGIFEATAVRDKAVLAAGQVQEDFSIMVTGRNDVVFIGLNQV